MRDHEDPDIMPFVGQQKLPTIQHQLFDRVDVEVVRSLLKGKYSVRMDKDLHAGTCFGGCASKAVALLHPEGRVGHHLDGKALHGIAERPCLIADTARVRTFLHDNRVGGVIGAKGRVQRQGTLAALYEGTKGGYLGTGRVRRHGHVAGRLEDGTPGRYRAGDIDVTIPLRIGERHIAGRGSRPCMRGKPHHGRHRKGADHRSFHRRHSHLRNPFLPNRHLDTATSTPCRSLYHKKTLPCCKKKHSISAGRISYENRCQ